MQCCARALFRSSSTSCCRVRKSPPSSTTDTEQYAHAKLRVAAAAVSTDSAAVNAYLSGLSEAAGPAGQTDASPEIRTKLRLVCACGRISKVSPTNATVQSAQWRRFKAHSAAGTRARGRCNWDCTGDRCVMLRTAVTTLGLARTHKSYVCSTSGRHSGRTPSGGRQLARHASSSL